MNQPISFEEQSDDEVAQICKDILRLDAKDRFLFFNRWSNNTLWYFIYIAGGLYGSYNRNYGLKILRKYILNMKSNSYKTPICSLYILDKIYILLSNYEYNHKSKSEIKDDIEHMFIKCETEYRFMEYIYNDPVMCEVIRNLAGIKV
jgi:hypothetical protein